MGSHKNIFQGREAERMAEELPDPIRRELRDAFWGSIGLYGDWGRGQPEPEVSLDGKAVPISMVCEVVDKFEDTMPDDLWRLLLAAPASGAEDPPDNQSYRSGARYLAHLIKERKKAVRSALPGRLTSNQPARSKHEAADLLDRADAIFTPREDV